MLRHWLFLLPLCLPLGAWAQDGIHHCVGSDGHPVFTDQPCAALQATPVAPAPRDSTPAATAASVTPSSPPVLCAATVADLRQSVLDAFSARDPNRLAGLMLWSGYGQEGVVADIRSLGSLMQRPLLDVEEPGDDSTGASAGPADAATAPPPSAPPAEERQLVVRTAANDGSGLPRETRFDVVRRSGCLWLRGRG